MRHLVIVALLSVVSLFGEQEEDMRSLADNIVLADPVHEKYFDFDVDSDRGEVITIDSQNRARDYVEAFKSLKEQFPDANIFAIIKGRSLDHISDMKLMGGGTLILVTVSRRNTTYSEAYKVEDFERIGHRTPQRSDSPVHYPASW